MQRKYSLEETEVVKLRVSAVAFGPIRPPEGTPDDYVRVAVTPDTEGAYRALWSAGSTTA